MSLKTYSHPELIEKFPKEVAIIFKIFGDDIRLVGGCVRDLLLKKEINDFDFATPLLPEKIIETLENNHLKAVPTGIKFGTITAVVNGENFEITTLRKDIENDGRHAKVEFVDDYFFDAARRDFTINALYIDFKGLIYDYFEGISDLKNQKVKFIGDAISRIEEDFLRILRFFRFSCNYASSLDEEGLKACLSKKENIKFLSADRVRNEIFKILLNAKKPALINFFKSLEDYEIRSEIFLAKFQIENLEKIFTIEEALNIKVSGYLRFFITIYKPDLNLNEIYLTLNFSNNHKKYFNAIFKNIVNIDHKISYEEIREIIIFEDKEVVKALYLLNLVKYFSTKNIKESLNNIEFINNFSLSNFPLNGEDVMRLGIKDEEVGAALKAAKIFWAKSDFLADKNSIMNFLQKN